MNTEDFGRVLKARRKELRIGQAALSELSGVAVHTISNIEQGKGNPTIEIMGRLLDVLGLELSVRPRGSGTT